jgi:alpha 1,3-glucosidase
MQQNISKHGRKMVTIVDPHIKNDAKFYIHKQATDLGFIFILNIIIIIFFI